MLAGQKAGDSMKIIIIIALALFPLACYALDNNLTETIQENDKSAKLITANKIMQNIYNEISKIKSSHEELKNFEKNCLTKDETGLLSIEYGGLSKEKMFPEKGDLWINIYFYNRPMSVEEAFEFKGNDFYIRGLGIYLRCSVWSEASIKNKILNIVNRETAIDRCYSVSDCVPASCCHASSLVNKKYAPDCAGIYCTMDCAGPLDCGNGEPACINNFCVIRKLKGKNSRN